jgi:hypothetical protein
MGDIVNLNQVRKARAREDERRKAEENRAKFGRSKPEKDVVQRLETKAERALDAHRREQPEKPDADK